MCPQEAIEKWWPSLGTVIICSPMSLADLHQAVARKREVHGFTPSIRWFGLVWTNCDDQHGQPALFHITTALYFL